jgi:adenosylhomocysteine nucleosidase
LRILGIVAALRPEARSLGSLPLAATGLVQLSRSALLYIAGMGAKQAQAAAEMLIAQNASALLSWGSAGALHPKLSPGNLILPKIVIYPQKGIFSTDDGWHNRLVSRLANQLEIFTEPLAQSLTVLRNPPEKLDFVRKNEALAVDMESGSVAEAAAKANLPFMAIRAIADPLQQNIPASALRAIDESGRFRPFHLLRSLARRPADFLVLSRLRRNFNASRTTLTTVAQLVGENFLAF